MAKIIPVPVANAASKQKALDDIWEFNDWMLYQIADSNTEQEYIEAYGYNNLEDLLIDNYSYEGEKLKKIMSLIRQYYQTIRPGDVKIGGKMNVEGYKNIELFCPDGADISDCFIVATKF